MEVEGIVDDSADWFWAGSATWDGRSLSTTTAWPRPVLESLEAGMRGGAGERRFLCFTPDRVYRVEVGP